MALHFDYALRLRSNSVKTPGLYGYAGVVVHRSASLASMYSFVVASLSLWHIAMPLGRRGVHTITLANGSQILKRDGVLQPRPIRFNHVRQYGKTSGAG